MKSLNCGITPLIVILNTPRQASLAVLGVPIEARVLALFDFASIVAPHAWQGSVPYEPIHELVDLDI